MGGAGGSEDILAQRVLHVSVCGGGGGGSMQIKLSYTHTSFSVQILVSRASLTRKIPQQSHRSPLLLTSLLLTNVNDSVCQDCLQEQGLSVGAAGC